MIWFSVINTWAELDNKVGLFAISLKSVEKFEISDAKEADRISNAPEISLAIWFELESRVGTLTIPLNSTYDAVCAN